MSETANIARMAEKLSNELFAVFGWKRTGPSDTNWSCVCQKGHNVKTHPADAVWYYDEPYSNCRTYIHADLKSYKKESITPQKIQTAIASLAKTVACAEESNEWKARFLVDSTKTSQVNGLLFVYNHDSEYDKDFAQLLKGVQAADVRFIPQNRSLIVLGPKDICELNAIVTHIKTLGSSGRAQNGVHTSFFFPELKLRKRTLTEGDPWNNAAPLPYLISKIISVKARKEGSKNPYDDLHIYYRGSGKTVEEFLHLIDYIFRFQQIQTASDSIIIHFVSLVPVPEAASLFDRAKNEYQEVKELKQGQLDKIRFESLQNFLSRYSEIELGMER